MNHQTNLSLLFVKELQKRNILEDIIEHEIETIRVCSCCGHLMNEGWIYQGAETYSSDKCLKKAHPYEDLSNLKEQACEEDSNTYWTQWEG